MTTDLLSKILEKRSAGMTIPETANALGIRVSEVTRALNRSRGMSVARADPREDAGWIESGDIESMGALERSNALFCQAMARAKHAKS